MIVIIGGAFQGKMDYAKSEFGLQEKEVFHCSGENMVIDFDKKAINNLERFTLAWFR